MPRTITLANARVPVRLVLDTNVWLDWLVFADSGITAIQKAVARGTACVFMSSKCEAELIRVLGYKLSQYTLDAAEQATALSQCRAHIRNVQSCTESHEIEALPRCEDPDDQMFLELARDCRADALITKDRDLLTLAAHKTRPLPFRIVTPRDFARDALIALAVS
jgi:uncharacterized protein